MVSPYQRLAMPPAAAVVTFRWVLSLDVRAVSVAISPITSPGARLVELDGADTLPFQAGAVEPLLSAIAVFLTGTKHIPHHIGDLATVLISDIVGSTAIASDLGDAPWRRLQRDHDAVVRGPSIASVARN